MKVFVINLDRTPQRYQEFTNKNLHIIHQRFSAFDGRSVDVAELVSLGVFNKDNHPQWSPGALGNFMSHRTLWRLCLEIDENITICEDDAILSNCFGGTYQEFCQNYAFDMMVWGYNMDTSIGYMLPNQFSSVMSRFSQNLLRKSVDKFRDARIALCPMKLLHCFGTPCYTISPAGAAKLIDFTRNMTNRVVRLKVVNEAMTPIALDGYLNAIYPEIDAYIAVPPFAITLNQRETSTVWTV